ncbi:MAG: hypothetical protein EOM65_17475 [Synergistales bacterium]|nr:hypothetical protein [Synergistales bacterium]
MTARILDGKKLSAEIRASIKEETALLREKGIVPGLAVVLVGDDPASRVYVGQKEKGCLEAGFASFLHRLPAATTQEELLGLIDRLNGDASVHGILVQLPLPPQIDPDTVLASIRPEKDVDGFTPINVGRMLLELVFVARRAVVGSRQSCSRHVRGASAEVSALPGSDAWTL